MIGQPPSRAAVTSRGCWSVVEAERHHQGGHGQHRAPDHKELAVAAEAVLPGVLAEVVALADAIPLRFRALVLVAAYTGLR
jgi:hypothetical protein